MSARCIGDYRMTPKQQQALACNDAGLSGYAIARLLGVSPRLIQERLRRARLLRESQAIKDRLTA